MAKIKINTKGTQKNGRKLSRKSAASSHPTLSDLSVGKDIAKAVRQRFKARFGQTAIAAVSSAYYVLLELQETVVANLPKVLQWKLKTPELHLRKFGGSRLARGNRSVHRENGGTHTMIP